MLGTVAYFRTGVKGALAMFGTLTPTSREKTGYSDSHFPLRPVKQGTLTPTFLKNRML